MTGRRSFVKQLGALTLLVARRGRADAPRGPQKGAPKESETKLPAGAVMPMRKLGATGVER